MKSFGKDEIFYHRRWTLDFWEDEGYKEKSFITFRNGFVNPNILKKNFFTVDNLFFNILNI